MSSFCKSKDLKRKYGVSNGVLVVLMRKDLIKFENGIIDQDEKTVLELIKTHTHVAFPKEIPIPDNFVSIEEAARIKGVSPVTVKRWADNHKIDIYKVFSESNEFVKVEDLEKMIVLRRRKNATEK